MWAKKASTTTTTTTPSSSSHFVRLHGLLHHACVSTAAATYIPAARHRHHQMRYRQIRRGNDHNQIRCRNLPPTHHPTFLHYYTKIVLTIYNQSARIYYMVAFFENFCEHNNGWFCGLFSLSLSLCHVAPAYSFLVQKKNNQVRIKTPLSLLLLLLMVNRARPRTPSILLVVYCSCWTMMITTHIWRHSNGTRRHPNGTRMKTNRISSHGTTMTRMHVMQLCIKVNTQQRSKNR